MDINKSLDSQLIRKDFPIINREIRPGIKLVYLDSAATSQKPYTMIKAIEQYYSQSNANIHRGIHTLAENATELYENARKRIALFIGAHKSREIIFTRNTTESINLVAYTWARKNLKTGDVVILTEMEHHSNLVPWQILKEEIGIRLEFIPVTPDGLLDLNFYYQLLKLEPRLVSFTHISNVLGTINPVKEIVSAAKKVGSLTLIDGAQSVPHIPVNIQDIGADFLAFSGHKMCGPTGIGVLYGREEILEEMPPFLGGGDMIKKVKLQSFTCNELPHKFEAGTPAIAEAVGLGAAVNYLQDVGMEKIADHEFEIIKYTLNKLSEIKGLNVLGSHQVKNRSGVASFMMDGIHPHDVAQILDMDGIAVRAGHHCAMPLHEKLNSNASTRASFYLYNTKEEVDSLFDSLLRVKSKLGK